MTGPEHYEAAEHFLSESDQRKSIEAARECVWTAQVHATLAAAAAIIDAANALAAGRRVDDEWAVVGTSEE